MEKRTVLVWERVVVVAAGCSFSHSCTHPTGGKSHAWGGRRGGPESIWEHPTLSYVMANKHQVSLKESELEGGAGS